MTLSPETVNRTKVSPVTRISVIIPVFNQQKKISYSLEKIKQAVESAFGDYELIVVNDGSTDDTLSILRTIKLLDPHIRIVSYTPNRGKGYAVKQGVLESLGEVVMFLDGDLDISPDSIKDYIERLDTCDLVIASKRHPESSVTIPRSRAFLSGAFHLIIRIATGISQKDTQAGFKVGEGDLMRAIFKDMTINRYAFDVELLTIASILKLSVQEMPVILKIDKKFKIKEIVNMLTDVARITYRYRIVGHYQHTYHDNSNNKNHEDNQGKKVLATT
jgi:dolichol-phosphate mannosyltransferase